MSNCNCGGCGQNRPLEDREYPDENEPTYDAPDNYDYNADEGIYDDPNYSVDNTGDPIFGGVTYAGAQYSVPPQVSGSAHDRDSDSYDYHSHDDYDEDESWIVRCPKCGRELYDEDTVCPNCGQYICEGENVQFSLWVIAGVTMAVIALLVAMVSFH